MYKEIQTHRHTAKTHGHTDTNTKAHPDRQTHTTHTQVTHIHMARAQVRQIFSPHNEGVIHGKAVDLIHAA